MQKCLLWGAAASLLLASTGAPAQSSNPEDGAADFAPVDDPTLISLVRETLQQHPQVLAAEAGVDVGQALERAADRPLFNPELGLDFESADTSDRVLRLTQTLDIAGRRGARTRVAARERDVSEELLAIARRDIAFELLSTLGNYWTAYELNELAAIRVELMQRLADVALQRSRAGDVTQVDLNLADLAYSQARIEGAGAAAELAAQNQNLGALVPPQLSALRPRLPVDFPAIDLTEGAITQLLADVPEIELQDQVLAVAAAEVTLRERERRPNPSVSLAGGEEEDESMIGLSFSMPLNVRNRFVYEVDAARARQGQAEREMENLMLRARAAVQSATVRYQLTRDAWDTWSESGAANLSQQTELLERLLRAGELSLTDYLVQLNQTLATQASALELQREVWLAWFEWLATTGQIGDWLGVTIETP